MEDILFKEGLREENLSKIKCVNKGDVHNHCGLGMRFSTFNEWAGGNVGLPPKMMDGLKGLDNYIFSETVKFIKTKDDLEFLIEATLKEAIEDGVKIIEPSIDCHWASFFDRKKEYFNSILNIKNKYEKYIDFRPEVGMPKGMDTKELEDLLVPCIDSGIFKSIDLYGEETKADYEFIKEYYIYAKKKGLKLKVHAGEFEEAENMRKAIEILEVDEIQHGIAAIKDDYLMELIRERKIRLNICPSSNYVLGAVKDMTKHPIKKLFSKGINLTINTDDLLLFNSGVSEEYLYLYKLGVFNEDELNEIRKNSLV